MNKNMTALVSCFVRYYHATYKKPIFNDYLAQQILTKEEINKISENMTKGIKFFNPKFIGNSDKCLKHIVDNYLSPLVLARNCYIEEYLQKNINQYLIFGSGYDTYAYRNKTIKVFEIDQPQMIDDKILRLKNSNIEFNHVNFIKANLNNNKFLELVLNSSYDKNNKAICSLLGISYYLQNKKFIKLLQNISKILKKESLIIFDYATLNGTYKKDLQEKLAKGANEEMLGKFNINDLVKKLHKYNLFLVENLNDIDINNKYFNNYNSNNKNKIYAPKEINYCCFIKK